MEHGWEVYIKSASQHPETGWFEINWPTLRNETFLKCCSSGQCVVNRLEIADLSSALRCTQAVNADFEFGHPTLSQNEMGWSPKSYKANVFWRLSAGVDNSAPFLHNLSMLVACLSLPTYRTLTVTLGHKYAYHSPPSRFPSTVDCQKAPLQSVPC